MNKLMIIVGAAVVAGCCNTNCVKDSGTSYVQEAIAPYIESGELPGAISVLYKDGVQEVCCAGYSDVANKRKITMDDVFMQCSQTKGFCGVTIAKLVEEGRLNLDDPVSKYLPEFATLWVEAGETNGVKTLKKAKNVLTVRMCLNHTGGFPFETSVKNGAIRGGGWSAGAPIRQTAACAAASPLLFEPGTFVNYSNTGIDIGAAVIEVITGKYWEDYLQETVLDPLEMTSTTFWPTDEQLETLVESYTCVSNAPAKYLREHTWQHRPYNDRSRVFASAGAGLWINAKDQLKFYKMLMNLGVGDNGVRILKEETVRRMLATSTRMDGICNKYGNQSMDDRYSLGLWAPKKDGDNEYFGHGGAWGTNCSINWHKKELKLWVVQLEGGPRPWDKARNEATDKFFKCVSDRSGDAYVGRTK